MDSAILPVTLYIPRKQGGEGLISIEECAMNEKKPLQNQLMNSEEHFTKMTLSEKVLDEKEDPQAYEKRIKEERNKNWKEKTLHGEYINPFATTVVLWRHNLLLLQYERRRQAT